MPPQDNQGSSADISAVAGEAKGFFKSLLADVKKGSTYKQISFGTAAGWLAGYMFLRTGKLAATTVGCTLLVTQIASHKGYINWKRINEDMQRVQSEVHQVTPGVISDLKRFASDNKYIAGGFAGGFFLGMACS